MSKLDQEQLIGIVISSHGGLAQALLDSAEMIIGEQDNVVAVSLDPQDNLDTLQAALNAAVDEADRGLGVIILIDLFGGTPGHAAALCVGRRKLPAVSGVNLPMLLEIIMSRRILSLDELSKRGLKSGTEGVVDIALRVHESIYSSKSD